MPRPRPRAPRAPRRRTDSQQAKQVGRADDSVAADVRGRDRRGGRALSPEQREYHEQVVRGDGAVASEVVGARADIIVLGLGPMRRY